MRILSYRYLPIHAYGVFTAIVLLALLFGPVSYRGLDEKVLMAWIGGLLIAFSVGFIGGARGGLNGQAARVEYFRQQLAPISRFAGIVLLLCLAVSLLQWFIARDSVGDFNLEGLGERYVSEYAGYERGQAHVNLIYILRIFSSAFLVFGLLLGFYYFPLFLRRFKVVFLFLVFSYLVLNVLGSGKQKYLGDIAIFLSVALALNSFRMERRMSLFKISCFVILISLVTFSLLELLRQRYAAIGIDIENIPQKIHSLIFWSGGGVWEGFFGERYALSAGILTLYLTNGLYGFYLSTTLPFEWTYFVGNSYSLSRVIEIMLGEPELILDSTLPHRVSEAYGWGFDKWHSLFSWFASDVGLFGLFPLAAIFGLIYGRLWVQTQRSDNPYAGPLFIWFSLGLVFSYANNQLLHTMEGVLVTFALFGLWLLNERWLRREVRRMFSSIAPHT